VNEGNMATKKHRDRLRAKIRQFSMRDFWR